MVKKIVIVLQVLYNGMRKNTLLSKLEIFIFHKMEQITHFLLVLVVTLFVSCDYPGLLELVNKTTDTIHITLYRHEINNTIDTLKVVLPNKGQETAFWFGYGHSWNNKNIDDFITNIEKIELVTEKDTLIISDKDKMLNYLKSRRKGIYKNIIRIELDDTPH